MRHVWARGTRVAGATWVAGVAVLSVASLVACSGSGGDSGGPTGPTGPSTPTVDHVTVSPTVTTLAAGATQQFTATALSSSNVAISGVTFTWASDDTTAVTVSASGLATAHHLGTAHISATTSSGTTGVTGSLPIAVTSGPATALQKQTPDPTMIAVGTALAAALAVKVSDAAGNPVSAAAVTWTASAGTLSAPSSATDSTGVARVSWTLGTTAGTQSVTATLGTSSVIFATTATPGPVATLAVTSASTNAQADSVDKALPTLTVIAKDRYANVVPGATVAWTASAGTLSAPSSLTDATGTAQVNWTLGASVGAATTTATAQGTNVAAQFTTTVHAGAPVQFTNVSGNNQSGVVNTTLSAPLTAVLVDRHGNPESAVPLTWSITGGGALSGATLSTTAQGLASTLFTLGTSTSQAQSATLTGGGKSVAFTATPVPGTPTLLTVLVSNVQYSSPREIPFPDICRDAGTTVTCTFTDPNSTPNFVFVSGGGWNEQDETARNDLHGQPCAAATAKDQYGNVITDPTQYGWTLEATQPTYYLNGSTCAQPPAAARNPPAPTLLPSPAILPPTRNPRGYSVDGRVITGSGGAQNGSDGGTFTVQVGTLAVSFHVYWF